MPKYICPRCGYICTQRNDMRKHFKRKKICSPVLEDISREKCFSLVLGETYENKISVNSKNVKNGEKPEIMQPKCNRNATGKIRNNTPEITDISKKQHISCEFCGRIFTKHQSYYRHKKDRCKVKDELTNKELKLMIDSRDDVIDKLSTQIEKLIDTVSKTSVNHTTHNHTTHNTTNHTTHNTFNFVVNAFGSEDLSYIKDNFITNLIQSCPYSSIPKLIQEIHFHPEHSENQNIKIPNKKLKLAQIFNGVDWEYKDKKETIENMTSKAYCILNNHYDKSTPNKYMDQFQKDFESGNKGIYKNITDKTELTILNNQDK